MYHNNSNCPPLPVENQLVFSKNSDWLNPRKIKNVTSKIETGEIIECQLSNIIGTDSKKLGLLEQVQNIILPTEEDQFRAHQESFDMMQTSQYISALGERQDSKGRKNVVISKSHPLYPKFNDLNRILYDFCLGKIFAVKYGIDKGIICKYIIDLQKLINAITNENELYRKICEKKHCTNKRINILEKNETVKKLKSLDRQLTRYSSLKQPELIIMIRELGEKIEKQKILDDEEQEVDLEEQYESFLHKSKSENRENMEYIREAQARDESFKQKYLKYKNKYLALKKNNLIYKN